MKLLKKLIIVIAILSLLSITLLGCKKKEEEKKDLRFNENGTFRILQLTDIQSIDDGLTEDTRCMLNSLIDESKPDFIILTGDNISSEYFISKKQKLLEEYTEMVDFLTSKKIYWTSTFGNHDGLMKVATKEELLNCLMKSPYFLGGIIDNDFCKVYLNKELDTYCNYSFPLKDYSGEKVLYNLMTLDTKTPLLADYSSYNTEQINWYNSIYNEYKNNNNNIAVPCLLFTHIPLKLYEDLYRDKDNEDVVSVYKGDMNEIGIAYAQGDTPFYDAMVNNKDIKGFFAGHDHLNTFAGVYKINNDYSVLLAYGRLSSYSQLIYNSVKGISKTSIIRGGRIIDLKIDGSFITSEALMTPNDDTFTTFNISYINDIDTKDYLN